MKIILTLILLIIFSMLGLVLLDKIMVENRLHFMLYKVLYYKEKNKKTPLNSSFFIKEEKVMENESFCNFYNDKIPGWGYCYYGVYGDDFFLEIRGYYTALTYKYSIDVFDDSYKYDF